MNKTEAEIRFKTPLPETNLDWLYDNTIFMTKAGSHSYGTNTPSSDLDVRGIVISPKIYHLGISKKFDQVVSKDPDLTIMCHKKFIILAKECNPNIIELLFVDEKDILYKNDFYRYLRDHRDLFITKKARFTFSGYAFSQLKRMKNHHERFVSGDDIVNPSRGDFGLPETATMTQVNRDTIRSFINQDIYEDRFAKIAPLLFNDLADVALKEYRYARAKKQYDHHLEWKANRNVKRAELEREHKYNTKHGSHLYRLLTMAKEILTGQGVIVKRPDANIMLDIRNGKWPYEKLLEYADNIENELGSLYDDSKLPKYPDSDKLDEICMAMSEGFWTE